VNCHTARHFRAILDVIADAGYAVKARPDQLQGIDHETGERYVIRFGDGDLYAAAVRLAERCGIELGDG
jgi:hypothetical protein